MKLTAQQGRGQKIHILIDGEYRLTVTRDFWASQSVHSGDELTDAEFAAFCEAAGSCRAFNAAVDILSRRDHSAKELERKVARRSGTDFAREAVERLEELGYVDDERYAQNLAQELYERRNMGKRRIEQELRERGVDRDIISACTQELDGDDVERITDLLNTKFHGKFLDEKGRRRTFNALIRLGYGYSDIRTAMRQADAEYDGEDDQFSD